jgi:CheY-like chemotaxis protein
MTTTADEPTVPGAGKDSVPGSAPEKTARIAADVEPAARALDEVAALLRQRHAFLAGLAHDLRNPLAPLSNGLELLRLTDADPAGRLRTRSIMERQVAHLMRIADNLSELARLTGENPSLQSNDFSLGELVRQAVEGAQPALTAREMSLEVADDPSASEAAPALRGDAQRLAEGLRHLIDDLLRHSEQGAALRLSTARGAGEAALVIEPAEGVAASEAALEDAQPAAFGLGVALCEQVALLHGGRLRVQHPAGGRRARFTLTLPLAAAREDGTAATQSRGERAGGASHVIPSEASLSVLLADDNVDFSRSFATMLELLGHRVSIVHDGLAAVKAIEDVPPDIAFIDIGMPSLDGFAAVQRVRGLDGAADVMLVAVTGRGAAEDRAHATECGFDRYLVKPFSMQDVRDALDMAQARRVGGR